jgi:hypothetical protein
MQKPNMQPKLPAWKAKSLRLLQTSRPWLLLTLFLLRPVPAAGADPVCADNGCHHVIKKGESAPFDGVLLDRFKLDGVTTELQRCLGKLQLEKTFLASVRDAEQSACERTISEQAAAHSAEAAALRSEKEAAQNSVLPLTLGAAAAGLVVGGLAVGIVFATWPK